jgi:hypothetical protein
MGYNVIRIDHTQLDNIETHLSSALHYEARLYLSTPYMYQHIMDSLLKLHIL